MSKSARSLLAPLAAAAVIGCGEDTAGPSLSLVGTWAVIEFVDFGVAGDVEGTAIFTGYGSYSFDVTVQFPGERPASFVASGTWEMVTDDRVSLSGSSGGMVHYRLIADGDRLILSSLPGDPVTSITLRSTSR